MKRHEPMTKILLVEDNEIDRDVLGRRLKRGGFDLCFAVDAPSGIALAGVERPDVILMDLSLGEMDGWEAMRRIRSNPATAGIPIIVLTSHPLARDRARSAEVGCEDFDTKPVDLARLLGKINACLATRPGMH
jgi:CheY-like chemotaxis protein